jgi:hypothetical protein
MPEVVFKGEKLFKEYEKKVEVLIVNHEEFCCIEFIVLGVSSGNKAARMYLSSALLVAKIDVQQFSYKFALQQETANRNNISFVFNSEAKRTALNMIATMLVSRFRILPSVFCNEFDVYFEPSVDDTPIVRFDSRKHFNARLDFEYDKKPPNLQPFSLVLLLLDQKRYGKKTSIKNYFLNCFVSFLF